MKMMKKILVLLIVMTPALLMAQAKKVPTNRVPTQQKAAPFVVYEYMTMMTTPVAPKAPAVQSPKKGKKEKVSVPATKRRGMVSVSFGFGKEKKVKELSKMESMAASFKTTVDALNYLGSRGWELVAKDGDTYLLKRARK